jgi:hypothetical protein
MICWVIFKGIQKYFTVHLGEELLNFALSVAANIHTYLSRSNGRLAMWAVPPLMQHTVALLYYITVLCNSSLLSVPYGHMKQSTLVMDADWLQWSPSCRMLIKAYIAWIYLTLFLRECFCLKGIGLCWEARPYLAKGWEWAKLNEPLTYLLPHCAFFLVSTRSDVQTSSDLNVSFMHLYWALI